jgi:class 3 adenylate cyclase
MATTRRLAAIFAADVAGYSRLMGADEEGTHKRLKAYLHEVGQKIGEHHGRIVKTTGDGVLAEFASIIDAVRCAAEIQRQMADSDLDLTEEQRIRFRIGIISATSSSTATTFTATGSTSPHGWRAWRHRAASVSRALSATI